jgi:integrase
MPGGRFEISTFKSSLSPRAAPQVEIGIIASKHLFLYQAARSAESRKTNTSRRAIILRLDSSLHGWPAFRHGLATNLHTLGVDDKSSQAILRHSNIGITQNIYIKALTESQVNAWIH